VGQGTLRIPDKNIVSSFSCNQIRNWQGIYADLGGIPTFEQRLYFSVLLDDQKLWEKSSAPAGSTRVSFIEESSIDFM
jgi:hypothetical protein